MTTQQHATRIALILGFLASLTGEPAITMAQSQDFRIETNVYKDSEPEPISHTVTLFAAGVVYDFADGETADKPTRIAVFRHPTASRSGQFILLDVAKKRRTEISTERIERLMEKLSRWAGEQEDELLQFSAKPEFEESFDKDSGRLLLTSPIWKYRVATVPAEYPAALARYREFSDWYARLNTMMHGTPPPMPRLKLNAAFERHGIVPVEIRRTVSTESAELRATHLFSWRLSREDRSRLDEASRYLASFDKVENVAFRAER